MQNIHLRNLRYHWYEINYILSNDDLINDDLINDDLIKTEPDIIEKLLTELENDIYYLNEFFPNDRNAFLFLDIYASEIAELLGVMKKYDALILLSNYDTDNRSTYNSFIK